MDQTLFKQGEIIAIGAGLSALIWSDPSQFWQFLLHFHLLKLFIQEWLIVWSFFHQEFFYVFPGFLRLLSQLVHFGVSHVLGGLVLFPGRSNWRLALYRFFQPPDILLLIPDQTAVAGIPNTHIKLQMPLLAQEIILEFLQGYELVVTPALPDVKVRIVLSHHRILHILLMD